MAVTFVAVGAVAEANNAAIAPALPAGLAAGDLLCGYGYSRSMGALVAPGAGWSEAFNTGATGSSRTHGLWWTRATGSDVAPTIDITGGADQNTVVGYCFAFRPSAGKALIVDALGVNSANASAANIGGINAPVVTGSSGVVVVFGNRNDDWTDAATLSGDSLTWVEMVDAISTAWGDLGTVADYAIFGSTPSLTSKTFTITGGANAIGVGRMVAFSEHELGPRRMLAQAF